MTKEYVDLESGEIEEFAGDAEDQLSRLVHARDDAHRQEKEWGDRRKMFDHMIMARMDAPKIVCGALVAKLAQRTTAKTDVKAFANALAWVEADRSALLEVVAAATGFKADKLLGEDVRRCYEQTTVREPSATWLEVAPVLRRAPAASRDLAPALEQSVAAAKAVAS
jgi:hypothetical protein